jgi:plastocyanin
METSHAGMELVEEEFVALVENLVGALDKFKVPDTEKNELLGALGPLAPTMVVPKDKLKPIDAAQLAKVTKLAGKQTDAEAKRLLDMAVVAGGRGQHNYAEQLFARAEMITGPKELSSIASVFRKGAPALVTSAVKTVPADSAAQPQVVGGSEADEPDAKPAKGTLSGKLTGASGTPMGVVMLFPAKGGKKRTPKQRTMEQRGKQFAPQLMAVPVGSTLSFPNFDGVYHNVFSLSKAKAFDLGMYKQGETREVKVDKPGIVRLGCNLHANMSAYIVVVDAPHYVIAQDGTFSFKSLAPGKYKVKTYLEGSNDPIASTVEIKEGANTVDIDVSGASKSGPSPDKFGNARE